MGEQRADALQYQKRVFRERTRLFCRSFIVPEQSLYFTTKPIEDGDHESGVKCVSQPFIRQPFTT